MRPNINDDAFLKKRSERQRKIRKRRLKVFFALFVICGLLTAIILSLTVLFPVKSVSIEGSGIYTSAQMLKAAKIPKDSNLFTLSGKVIEQNLKGSLPYIDSIKLERKLPDTINIKVKDANKYICYEYKKEIYIVSKSGWVMEKVTEVPEKLGVIKGVEVTCKVGQAIIYKDEKSLDLINTVLNAIKKENLQLTSLNLKNLVAIELELEDRLTVNLGTSNDIQPKIKHLASMMEKIPNENRGKINLSMWTSSNTQATFTPETD